ncbi:ATP-binding protein [Intrasporangium calvum]|uniref:ATP-binding protein n=1 Tax=Intrasporangium calvum TaxID=53358 RepID=A0ABT5GDJ3_9MICO|nr:ATP-binding protein [Intrasporangium calvum]MDC5696313.1 ATP-binding protein [Intrasporangium calvum]
MDDWDIAEPRADALIESLRAFGYSPEAAVADLLDNSISAGARTIDVEFYWNGAESHVAVRDDGRGMDSAALFDAMRPGSASPLEERDPKDLGRFGLGLKTASFSQARELTVITRTADSEKSVRRWDLDLVGASGEWRLLRSAPASLAGEDLGLGPGTLVVWTKCDRLVGQADVADTKAQSRFNQVARKVGVHLAAVFHRFMVGRGKVTIRLNGTTLQPWDPFMESHPATQNLGTERLPLKGSHVDVTPLVLPHRSKLTDIEQRDGAGEAGWNQQQGFYLYRGDRLLVQGDWLGLGFAKEEHTKLARIAVDIPTTLDHEWQVDVKKSSARAPGPLQADLRRIATATRRQAEEIYRHRGKLMVRRTSQDFVMAWLQYKTRDGELRYRVNRAHPVIRALLDASGDNKRIVERSLRFIEETIPTTMIGVSIADALDQQPVPFSESRPELAPLLRFVFDGLVDEGLDNADALARIAAAEPFIQYPEVVEAFRESIA